MKNSIGKMIEEMEPQNKGKRIYHSLTRDLLLNELFRRVEPNKRTMGQFLRE